MGSQLFGDCLTRQDTFDYDETTKTPISWSILNLQMLNSNVHDVNGYLSSLERGSVSNHGALGVVLGSLSLGHLCEEKVWSAHSCFRWEGLNTAK